MLRFLYTGNAPNIEEEEMTEPMFIAADKYQIEKLKNGCVSIMIKKLNVENAVRFLVLAYLQQVRLLGTRRFQAAWAELF